MKKVRKVVFPVGGFGTRFLPATKSIPKEMLPVDNIPLIQHAFEEARAAGMEQFIFITGRNKSAINNHFDVSYELNAMLSERDKQLEIQLTKNWLPEPGKIVFIRQQVPMGLGHALLCAKDVVGDEPFAVILADEFLTTGQPCLKQMVQVYNEHGDNVIGMYEAEKSSLKNYGVAAVENFKQNLFKLTKLVEKPKVEEAPSNLIIVGRYILQPKIFDFLSQTLPGANNEIQLTDAMNAMIQDKNRPLSKLATEPKCEEHTEHRSGVYSDVHEHSSTGATKQLGLEVEFEKRSNKFLGLVFDGHRFDCGEYLGWLEANIFCALSNGDRSKAIKQMFNRLLSKLAFEDDMREDLGAQDRSVLNVREAPSTKSPKKIASKVEFGKKSNKYGGKCLESL